MRITIVSLMRGAESGARTGAVRAGVEGRRPRGRQFARWHALVVCLAAWSCQEAADVRLTLRWPNGLIPDEPYTVCFELAAPGSVGNGSRTTAPEPSEYHCAGDDGHCAVADSAGGTSNALPLELSYHEQHQLRILVKVGENESCKGSNAWAADYYYVLREQFAPGSTYLLEEVLQPGPNGSFSVERAPESPSSAFTFRFAGENFSEVELALDDTFDCGEEQDAGPRCVKEEVEPNTALEIDLCKELTQSGVNPCEAAHPSQVYARFWNDEGFASRPVTATLRPLVASATLQREPEPEPELAEAVGDGDGVVYFSEFQPAAEQCQKRVSAAPEPVGARLVVNLSDEPLERPGLAVRRLAPGSRACPQLPTAPTGGVPEFALKCGGANSPCNSALPDPRELEYALAPGGFAGIEPGSFCLYLEWPASGGRSYSTQALPTRMVLERAAPLAISAAELSRTECAEGCDEARLRGNLAQAPVRPGLAPTRVQVFDGPEGGRCLAEALAPGGEFDLALQPPFDPLSLYVRHVTLSGAVSEAVRVGGGTWTARIDGTRHVAREWGAVEPGLVPYGGTELSGAALQSLVAEDDTAHRIWARLQWQQLLPAEQPPPRAGAAMVYDARLGQVVLVGGETVRVGPIAATRLHKTWHWNGARWGALGELGVKPPRLRSDPNQHGAVHGFDERRARVLLFDVRETKSDNKEVPETTVCGIPRRHRTGLRAVAPEGGLEPVAEEPTRTSGLEEAKPSGPTLVGKAALAYDPERGTSVLFGTEKPARGACQLSGYEGKFDQPQLACEQECLAPSTWELSEGGTWQKQPSSCEEACPPPPGGRQLAYSPRLGGLVYLADSAALSGGGQPLPSETWLLRKGEPWQPLAIPAPPRIGHTLLRTAHGLLAVGGRCAAGALDRCSALALRCETEPCEWQPVDSTPPVEWVDRIGPACRNPFESASESPCGHTRRLFAYDWSRDQVVHFRSHFEDPFSVSASTWVLDLSATPTAWVEKSGVQSPNLDAASQPTTEGSCRLEPGDDCCSSDLDSALCVSRTGYSLLRNEARDSTLMHGGRAQRSKFVEYMDSSHEWNNVEWTERTPIGAAPQPAARSGAAMSYTGDGLGQGEGRLKDGQGDCQAEGEQRAEQGTECNDTWRWLGPRQPALTVAFGAEGLFGVGGAFARCVRDGSCQLGDSALNIAMGGDSAGAVPRARVWTGQAWEALSGGEEGHFEVSARQLQRSLSDGKFQFQIIPIAEPGGEPSETLSVNAAELQVSYGSEASR